MERVFCRVFVLSLLLTAPTLQAQQFERFGDFEVHFNVLNTDQIPVPVAQGYGIKRSSSRALLSVTVLDSRADNGGTPVHVRVAASAVNLTGQRREIPMREINDPDHAVYYIGEIPVHHLETYNFTLEVGVEGEPEPFEVRFRQQFYTE
jgi:hypothetical protein